MGNNSRPVETKRRKKKKGRPSLLELQKRTLRLQKLQSQNPNPNPNPNPKPPANPYLRYSAAPSRRSTRRNPNPDPAAEEEGGDDDDEEDQEGGNGGRKEKKLRFVLRLPHRGPDSPSSSAESGGGGARKRRIGDIGADRDQRGAPNSASKATDGVRGQCDSGPTTSLPDKKLLVFILDRLQKKDTYGVFSEPVDPEELPDYHDIIKHPMDFATVRKKLADGVYANLEQFEKDVFLISSNAMRYNSSDTIYHRHARAIEELAKKDFENLRQESDDSEPEQKPRRGRPPIKSIIRKKVGRPPSVRPSSDPPSDATLANAGNNGLRSHLGDDLSRKGPDAPRASYGLRNIETRSWLGEQKPDRNEDLSGSAMKGFVTKYGKKPFLMDELPRNTYMQPQQSTFIYLPPIANTFDVDRKQLVPVGLQIQHTYARSLARFAAKLGPIGWEIAAKRIERVLPPGTKFGPGWVGENEAPQHSHLPLVTASPPCSSIPQNISPTPPCTSAVSPAESPSNSSAAQDRVCETNLPTPSLASSTKDDEKAAQPTINGFNSPSGFAMASQIAKVVESSMPRGSMGLEPRMIHGNANLRSNNTHNYRVPVIQHEADKAKLAGYSDSGAGQQGVWRGFPLHSQRGSDGPPDLNVGFQSPGSPTSKSVLVDQKQPDLALQL